MTTRENPLKRSLMGMQDHQATAVVQPFVAKVATGSAPSRQGKRPVSGYFEPAAVRQLKMLSIERDASVQELLGEALNDLFRKYGKSAIA